MPFVIAVTEVRPALHHGYTKETVRTIVVVTVGSDNSAHAVEMITPRNHA